MQRFLTCLTVEHDWRLTLLAVAVCVLGLGCALGVASLSARSPRLRMPLAVVAGVLAGLSIWATHFLAMIGYQAGVAVTYAALPTAASLLIVLCGFGGASAIMLHRQTAAFRSLAAVAAITGIGTMHFIGMSGLEFAGHFLWDPAIVAVAVGSAVILAVLAGLTISGAMMRRLVLTGTLGALAIVALHFGSMAALTVVPDPASTAGAGSLSADAVLIWAGLTVLTVVGLAAAVFGVGYWSRYRAVRDLREAIDAMSDGLGFYDRDDRLVVWNARYAEVNPEVASTLTVGMRFRDILQMGIEEGLYADAVGREEAWIAERLAVRRTLSNTMEQPIAGGRWLRIQDRRTSAGGLVTVCSDITDLKRDAQALAEARDAAEAANRAKSEFLANMSHEIRTPLNGVIGLAQALARTDLGDDQREMLDLIQSSGHTLQTLLSDILDLARVESGRLELADEPFDVTRAVQDAAQLYAGAAADKGLPFFVDIEPEAAVWARGDAVRLKQVLTNLVSNAVKFTSQGFVSLTVARGTQADGAALLRFTVEDTGVGFDAAARARLFTRFEQADGTITRRFGGSGLGLAICRQLADMMGGDLDCESEPGGGSAFILTLPLREVEAADAEPQALLAIDETGAARIRVLLADDHPTNRKVVELVLGQSPVDVVSVVHGAEALAAYRDGAFDLVLMDMQMPVMDGLTATREIRLHELAMGLMRVPIVMLTANALPDHIAASEAAGADRHLAKPFDAGELLRLVGELTSEPRALAA